MTMMLPIQKEIEDSVQEFRRPEEVLEQLRERKEKQLVRKLANQRKAKAEAKAEAQLQVVSLDSER